MKLLLDTHTFLWFVFGDSKLSPLANSAIVDTGNDIFISPASFWELAINVNLGKYPLHVPFETFVTQAIDGNGFTLLPIEPKHAAILTTLPHHHRDPFDRMIIAQAIAEQFSVVGADQAFDLYPVVRIW